MKRFLIFLLIVFISLISGLCFFLWQGIYLPKDKQVIKEKLFFVERGEGIKEISSNLEEQRLIKDQLLFKFYILIRGISAELQSGVYLLSPSMSISEIANKIADGDVFVKEITIPEGFIIKQIEERFSETFNREMNFTQFRVVDFQDEFDFLRDVSETKGLEGFLFPDTYQFHYLVTEEEIVRTMLESFNKRLTLEIREEIARQDKSIFEIIIMASMLEREVRTLNDKKMVSDIFWRRRNINMPLQVDATIVYILQKKGLVPEQGWTFEEMRKAVRLNREIDSPYNTYLNIGLPPGPISNPGLNSILAAIKPKNNKYWFFLSTPPAGETIFSRTYREHKDAINRYFHY